MLLAGWCNKSCVWGRGGLVVIVVSGYYGFANLGDEAILAALCDDIETLGFSRKEILVLSQNPVPVSYTHLDVYKRQR